MTSLAGLAPNKLMFIGDVALRYSARLWLTLAIIGQLIFAYYILVFYGGTAVRGDWQAWSSRMIHGIIEGDSIGNLAVMVHIFFAFVINVSAPLQFTPQIRIAWPKFHRLNGRLYIATAYIISVGAIYMQWSRDSDIGGVLGSIGTTIDAILIIIFATMALKTAINRQIQQHTKWVLRLFIVASGVWLFRVIRGFWMTIHNGESPGSNATLTGPFDVFVNFGGFLVPLLILEMYFVVKRGNSDLIKVAYAHIITLMTIVTCIGIFGATKMFWWSGMN